MTVNTMANSSLQLDMIRLSTMKRVNSAADDAAGLAIAEKLDAQVRGLDQGTDNTLDMQNLVQTAEGGLSGIGDSLQRVRELSVQASNGILNDDDRSIIQNEISSILQGINGMVDTTEFNRKKLLDGTFVNQNTASDADGTGMKVSIDSMSLEALGLEDYDVTGEFDISKIDSALSKVNSARSSLGAVSNTFDYTVNANSIASLNLAAAKSRTVDLDVAKGSMDLSKSKVLQDYSIYAQKQEMERQKTNMSLLF